MSVREAAIRAFGGPSGYSYCDTNRALSVHPSMIADLETCARWILDNVPADEGEAVTEEWLRSIGFVMCAHWGALRAGDWNESTSLEWDHGKWKLTACRFGFGANTDYSYEIPAPKNRSDVVHLCFALGIPIESKG